MSTVGIVVPAYNDYTISAKTWGVLRKHPYFEIVRAGHSLGEARNIGISRLRTDYILPLDGDDYLNDGIIEAWQKALDEHPEIDVVYADHQGISGGQTQDCFGGEWTREAIAAANVTTYCIMFRKSAWEKVGGYSDIVAYEDWEFIARLYRAGCKGMKLNRFGLIHVNHGDNKCTLDDRRYGPAVIKSWLADRVPEVFK